MHTIIVNKGFPMKATNHRVLRSLIIMLISFVLYACGSGSGPSDDDSAELDSLNISVGDLDQTFQSTQLSYTATVGYLAKSISITATTNNPGATITVNGLPLGAGNTSQLISLVEGVNPSIDVVVTNGTTNKQYTIDVTRDSLLNFAEQAYIKASNPSADDKFGIRARISGDTLVVGAPYEDSDATGINGPQTDSVTKVASGAVYVFVRNGGTWSQQAYIKAHNIDASDHFGVDLDISGDTLVVGATLEDARAEGVNQPADDDSWDVGAAYVFTRTGTTWSQEAYIKPGNHQWLAEFGAAVSIDGDTLAVGMPMEKSSTRGIDTTPNFDEPALDSGAVYVFTRNGTTWSQQAYIKSSNSDDDDHFGRRVDVEGNTLVVSAPYEDGSATGIDGDLADNNAFRSGAVYVFTRTGNTWSEQNYIKASNTEAGDNFGSGLSLSGDTLVVGAWGEDSNATGINGDQSDNSASYSGAVYIFTRNGTSWDQQAYIKSSNNNAFDYFGTVLDIDGDTLVVGAGGEDSATTGVNGDQTDESASYAGAAYLFTRSGGVWSQQAYIKASNTETEDRFGFVSLSGDTMVVGVANEDSNSTGVNSTPNDDGTAIDSGAVYVFN